MERLVEVKLAEVHILAILDCYYRLFPLTYISYDPKGITIQGSNKDRKILATTVVPQESSEHYECKESMVIAVPLHLGQLGGRCVSIEVLKMDSWRVKNVFKSNNGVSYEAISSYMYELNDSPSLPERMSFERYSSTKKFPLCDEDPNGKVEGEINESRVESFKVDILRISKFIVGDPGESYCTIPIKCFKLLNKFLGTTINTSKIEFCKSDGPCGPGVEQRLQNDYLFSIDNQYYYSFSGPNVCLARLQMELCWAANAKIKSQHFGVSLKFLACN